MIKSILPQPFWLKLHPKRGANYASPEHCILFAMTVFYRAKLEEELLQEILKSKHLWNQLKNVYWAPNNSWTEWATGYVWVPIRKKSFIKLVCQCLKNEECYQMWTGVDENGHDVLIAYKCNAAAKATFRQGDDIFEQIAICQQPRHFAQYTQVQKKKYKCLYFFYKNKIVILEHVLNEYNTRFIIASQMINIYRFLIMSLHTILLAVYI